MKYKLYCVRDDVAKDSGPVQQFVNDGVAMRWYEQNMRSMAETLKADPRGDFNLYCVGSYDSETMNVDFISPERIVQESEMEITNGK